MKPKLKLTENFKFSAYLIGLMVFFGALFVLAALFTHPFQDMVVYLNSPHESRPWADWAIFWVTALLLGPFWTCCYILLKVCEKQIVDDLLSKGKGQTSKKKPQPQRARLRGYGRAITSLHQCGRIANQSRLIRIASAARNPRMHQPARQTTGQ